MRAPRPLPSPLPPSGAVCSTITTASASAGRKPPVAISTASPAAIRPWKTSPIGTDPTTFSTTSDSSEAVWTSAARTAKPSMTDRRSEGRLSGAAKACPRTRPSAAVSGTRS